MTPFDPFALVAMLEVFYPVVSVANLHKARADRPEYFAGGTLGGSKGEKLFLPDGRVWDLIFAAGAVQSAQRWQALDVTDDPGGPADPFPLEDGPLAPLDDTFIFPPRQPAGFESLVAGELAELGASDDVLQRAAIDAAEAAGAVAIEGAFTRHVAPALEAQSAMRHGLAAADPSDELEAAGLQLETIPATLTEYDEDPPDDIPENDPGEPPRDDEEGRPPREKDENQ